VSVFYWATVVTTSARGTTMGTNVAVAAPVPTQGPFTADPKEFQP